MKKVLFFLSFLFLGIITITLASCSKKYMIRFYAEYDATTSEYKTLLEEKKVAKGDVIVYEGQTPIKASDSNYTYTFKGWDHKLGEATQDDNYYAVFNSVKILKDFTIIFQNYDGKVLQTSTVKEGAKPVYNGETPTRPSNNQYDYTFAGWNKEIVAATKDERYTATYTQTAKVQNVTITWDIEGTTSTSTITKGGKAVYTSTPTKAATAAKTYTFAGWKVNGEGNIIDLSTKTFDSDTRLVATFTEATRKYDITWVVDGQSETVSLDYGATPTHSNPTKSATSAHSYTFTGWTPEIVSVSANATYTAVFDVTDLYSVKLNNTVTSVTDTKTGTDKFAFTLTLSKDDVIVISLGDDALKFVEKENATSYTAPRDGEYKFFVNAENKVYVEEPAEPEAPKTYTLKGSFDLWSSGYDFTFDGTSYTTAEVALYPKDVVKVSDGEGWLGYSDLADKTFFNTDASNNIVIKESAIYKFTIANNQISFTHSTYQPSVYYDLSDETKVESMSHSRKNIPDNVSDQFQYTFESLAENQNLKFGDDFVNFDIATVSGNATKKQVEVNGELVEVVSISKDLTNATVYLKVSMTDSGYSFDVYVGDTEAVKTYTLKGDFDAWGTGQALTKNDNSEYILEELFMFKNGSLKITDGTDWFGYDSLTSKEGFEKDLDNNVLVPETAYYNVIFYQDEFTVVKANKEAKLYLNEESASNLLAPSTKNVPAGINDQFQIKADITKDEELTFVFEGHQIPISSAEGLVEIKNNKVIVKETCEDAAIYLKVKYSRQHVIVCELYVGRPQEKIYSLNLITSKAELVEMKKAQDDSYVAVISGDPVLTLQKGTKFYISDNEEEKYGYTEILDAQGFDNTLGHDEENNIVLLSSCMVMVSIKTGKISLMGQPLSISLGLNDDELSNYASMPELNKPNEGSFATFEITKTLDAGDKIRVASDGKVLTSAELNSLTGNVYANENNELVVLKAIENAKITIDLVVTKTGMLAILDVELPAGERVYRLYNDVESSVFFEDENVLTVNNVIILKDDQLYVSDGEHQYGFESLKSNIGFEKTSDNKIVVKKTGLYKVTFENSKIDIVFVRDLKAYIKVNDTDVHEMELKDDVRDGYIITFGLTQSFNTDDSFIFLIENKKASLASFSASGLYEQHDDIIVAKDDFTNARLFISFGRSASEPGKITSFAEILDPIVEKTFIIGTTVSSWETVNESTVTPETFIYVFDSKNRNSVYKFMEVTKLESNGIYQWYKVNLSSEYDTVIVLRCKDGTTLADLDWNTMTSWLWNQTVDTSYNASVSTTNAILISNLNGENKYDTEFNSVSLITINLHDGANVDTHATYFVVGSQMMPLSAVVKTGYDLVCTSGEYPEFVPEIDTVYELEFQIKSFDVHFYNGENELYSTKVNYHNHPAYVGDTPTKTREGYTCVFAGWAKLSAPTSVVDLEDQFIEEETTYVAVFDETPNQVDYTVKHMLQDATDASLYVEDTTLRETLHGTADANTQAQDKEITGFELYDLTQVKIKADGTTVVEVKYNRKVMTVTLDKNGAPGTKDGTAQIVYGATSANSVNKVDYPGRDFVGCAIDPDGDHIIINTDGSFNNYEGYVVNSKWINTSDNIKLYLIWSIQTFDITFDGNGATTGEMTKQTVDYNTNVTLTSNAYARTGYIYQGWNTESDGTGTDYANGAEIQNVTANIILYAKWTPIKYTIAFNANEGTGSIDSITNVEYDVEVTLPVNTITRDGYIFVGWALESTGESHYSNQAVVSNLTTTNNDTVNLYAVWTQKFVVTYVLNGGTIDSKTSYVEFFEKGENVNVAQTSKTPVKEGHTFEGWYANEGLTTPATFGSMNTTGEGMTVYANYTENSYTLTWVFNGGTPASDNYTLAGSVKYGTNIVYPTLSKTGYTMVWDDVPPTTMPADDLTITAIWTAKTFTVTFDPNGGALPGSDTLEVTYDQKYPDLPHATKTNYTLEGWFTAATGGTEIHGGDADGDVVQITSDATYYAHWVGEAFSVKFMDGENEYATVGQTFGSTYNLPANNPTKEGHTFKGWYTASTDGDKIDASTTITTKTATFYAQFTKTEYTITYHNVDGATHSNPTSFYIDSEDITLTDASKANSIFLGWYTELEGGNKVESIPTGTKTSKVLYAHWRDNQYTIHFDKNGSENVTGVMVNMTCDYGHKYNLNANAYSWDYYNFLGWTVNQDGSGTLYTDGQEVENLSSTDGATVTLYAKWQALYVVEVNGTKVTVSEVTPESGNKYQFEYALTSGNTMTVHHGENLLKIGESSNVTTYTATTTGVHTVYVNASDRLFINAYTYFFKGDFNNWGETTPLVWAPSKNAYELENVFLIKGSGVKVEYGDNNWYGYDSLTDKTNYTRGADSHNDDIILSDDNATGYYTISFAWSTKKITLTRTSGPAYTFNDAAMSPNATGLDTSLWNDQFYLDAPVEAGDTLSLKLGESVLTFTYSTGCKNLEEVNSVKQFKRDDDHAKIYLKLKYVVNAGIVSIAYEVYTSATDTYSLVGEFNNWSQGNTDFLTLNDGTYIITKFLLRNSDILLKKNAGETDETLLKYSSLTSTTNLSEHNTNIRVGETGYYTITYSSTGPVFTVIKTANDNTVISVNDEQMQENANNQFELEKALTAGAVLTFKANGDAIGIRNLTGNVEKDGYDLVVKTTFLSKILVSLYYENGTIVYDLDVDEPKEYKLCIDSDLDHGSLMTWNTEDKVYEIENVVIIKDCDARAGLGDNLIGNSIKSSETAKYRVTLTKNEVLSIEKTNDIVVEVNNHQMTIDRTNLGAEYKEQYKLTEQAFSDDEQLTFTINGVSQIIYKVEGNALLNPSTGVASINYGIDGLNGESIYFKLKYDNGNLVAHIYVDGPKDFVVMYLDPNIWNDPDPTKVERYEVYAFKDGVRSDWFTMKAVTGTNLYTAKISTELYDQFIFVRCDSTQAEHNWDSKWNQSYDLTLSDYHKNVYKITAWGTDKSEGSLLAYSLVYNPE